MKKIKLIYEKKIGNEFIPNGLPKDWVIHHLNQQPTIFFNNEEYTNLPVRSCPNEDIFNNIGIEPEKVLINEVNHIDSNCYLIFEPHGCEEQFFYGYSIYKGFLDELSETTLKLLKTDQLKILINYCYEPYPHNVLKQLDQYLTKKGIDSKRVYFMSGNLLLEEINKTRINVLSIGDYFNYSKFFMYKERKKRLLSNIKKNKLRKKKFLYPNRNPHLHRLILTGLLLNENFEKENYVSFPKDMFYKNDDLKYKTSDFDSGWHKYGCWYKGRVSEGLATLRRKAPLIIDKEDFSDNDYMTDINECLYTNSYISIVSETLFFSDDNIFFSEKLNKTIECFHPFILVGTAGSLEKLRELGFQTFSPWINEEYDQIKNHWDRLYFIKKEILRLSKMDFCEVHALYMSLLNILNHNYENLKNFNKDREKSMRFFNS